MSIPYHSSYTGDEIDASVTQSQRELLTGLTGGTAYDLDGIATVDLPLGSIARITTTSSVIFYRLIGSTDDQHLPNFVKPLDYAIGTNEKVWNILEIQSSTMTINTLDFATDSATEIESISHRTTLIPVSGFGSKKIWKLDSGNNTERDAAFQSVSWTDSADGTRSAGIEWGVADNGVDPVTGLYFRHFFANGKRWPGLGINCVPQKMLHIKFSYLDPNSMCAFENEDSTDGSGVVMSFRSTTTGTGGAPFIELCGFRTVFVKHDHATRQGEFQFYNINGSGVEILKWRPGYLIAVGGLTDASNDLSLSRAAAKIWRLGDGAANANGWFNYAGQKRVTAKFDKTDVTRTNIPGLSVNLIAGRTYRFRAVLFVDANATGGGKYCLSGTVVPSSIIYHIKAINDATGAVVISSRQTVMDNTAGQAGATALKIEIEGVITVTTAGTLTVQFAQNAASGTSSVLVGSTFIVEDIP